VDALGGPDALMALARQAFDAGDFRWAAELMNHLVFADPGHQDACALQAATLEQLAFGAENGTWRNFFLAGATELRGTPPGTPTTTASADLMAALSLAQLFDSLAIRVDGPRAATLRSAIDWTVTGPAGREQHWSRLVNGVLAHGDGTGRGAPDARIRISRAGLLGLAGGTSTPDDLAGDLSVDGSADALDILLGVLDRPDPDFAIVTP
jgi:alkyl sulfatase BDS1-like metallo-beta-lactamase superfamily hydrolase